MVSMIYLTLTVLAVFAVLLLSEIGYRKKLFVNELGRKLVHVLVGSFVAFWPHFLAWNQIRLLSLAFVLVVLVSLKFKVFRAIHSVQRATYGELCFALTVGLLTFMTQDKAIYAVALLQMSLADGFAAIFGNLYGKRNTYHIFGHGKSVVGTAAFIITSLTILVGYSLLSGTQLAAPEIAIGVAVATLFENVAPVGLDNLAVPLFIAWLLML